MPDGAVSLEIVKYRGAFVGYLGATMGSLGTALVGGLRGPGCGASSVLGHPPQEAWLRREKGPCLWRFCAPAFPQEGQHLGCVLLIYTAWS